MMAELLGSAY